VGEERRAVQARDALAQPDRIPRIGVGAEHARGEGIVGHVVRLLAAVPDLGDEEVAHGAERALGQRGTEGHVGHQLEHLAPVAAERGGGDLAVVGVGDRLDAAAHAVGRLDDLHAVHHGRAAHGHELEEIGDAGDVARLPAGSHLDLERVGDEGRHRVLAHEHGEAVGQLRPRHSRRGGLRGGRAGGEGQDGEREGGEPHGALGTKSSRAY
jgi:hypothetical protein